MSRKSISILYLGNKNSDSCRDIADFLGANTEHLTICLGEWGDPLPDEAKYWEGDYIISYFSRWIVPEYLLKKARIAAINIHPASPDYPGIGCNNFALYEGAKEYGVTCHHMNPKVDTGDIIAVKRFPIYDSDDVESLLNRTYNFCQVLFYEIAELIMEGKPLPSSNERWSRKPFTRKQLNALSEIRPDMTRDAIERRIRATKFGQWKPYIKLHNFIFKYEEEI